ncbi:MAG: MFS transporter [Desulfobacteraceae bacterium 4572_35.2]|nr:MAG: MFS transporter [Desulfobacteraceae bacterium 4572_35.2]
MSVFGDNVNRTSSVSQTATLVVVCVAHFLMPFMMSAVGVALPVIGREFSASAVQLGLVETTYALSASVFLLAMGRLGDLVGRRQIFRLGLVIFTVSGGLISQAWSIDGVILLRLFQGIGGSMVMATTMAMVVTAFPATQRGRALGIATASVYAGISCGPFLGGSLVSWLGWRSIFYLGVPLGVMAFIVATVKLTEEGPTAKGESFDWRGWIIYALSILALISGVMRLNDGVVWWLVASVGVAGFILFLWYESRQRYPLLNTNLLRHNRMFALSNIAALFNYAGTFGITFFLSLYLQYVKGFPPHTAGLVLIVQPIVQTIFSPMCGRLSDRFPAAKVATVGMLFCAAGIGVAATISKSTSLGFIVVVLVMLGAGFALFSTANTNAIMGSVAARDLGVASGFAASMRTLGMMASMAIITVMFSLYMGEQSVTLATQNEFVQSMQSSLLVFSGLCVAAVASSFGRHPSN